MKAMSRLLISVIGHQEKMDLLGSSISQKGYIVFERGLHGVVVHMCEFENSRSVCRSNGSIRQ